jgi:hypothetical protein
MKHRGVQHKNINILVVCKQIFFICIMLLVMTICSEEHTAPIFYVVCSLQRLLPPSGLHHRENLNFTHPLLIRVGSISYTYFQNSWLGRCYINNCCVGHCCVCHLLSCYCRHRMLMHFLLKVYFA